MRFERELYSLLYVSRTEAQYFFVFVRRLDAELCSKNKSANVYFWSARIFQLCSCDFAYVIGLDVCLLQIQIYRCNPNRTAIR